GRYSSFEVKNGIVTIFMNDGSTYSEALPKAAGASSNSLQAHGWPETGAVTVGPDGRGLNFYTENGKIYVQLEDKDGKELTKKVAVDGWSGFAAWAKQNGVTLPSADLWKPVGQIVEMDPVMVNADTPATANTLGAHGWPEAGVFNAGDGRVVNYH